MLPGDLAADIDEPGKHLRHLHHREQTLRPEPLLLLQLRADVEPAIVVTGRGMCRIDRHRRQDRQGTFVEEPIDTGELLGVEVGVADELESLGDHRRCDALTQAAVLPGDELLGAIGDPPQLLQRRDAVGRRVLRRAFAERLLADPRHPDHEKLVEVRAENGEELHPLHQRIADILRLLEDPEVEFEPAQFPVDEAFRAKRCCGGVGSGHGAPARLRSWSRSGKWPWRRG